MMTICPSCRHVHEESVLTLQGVSYGPPIKTCKHCGQEYYDPAFREAALSGIPAFPRPQKLRALLWMAIIVPLLFLAAALLLDTGNRTFLITCAILLAVVYAAYFVASWIPYFRAKRLYAKELVQSKARLANDAYVQKLLAYRERFMDELQV